MPKSKIQISNSDDRRRVFLYPGDLDLRIIWDIVEFGHHPETSTSGDGIHWELAGIPLAGALLGGALILTSALVNK